jgi:hypothetical protein
MRTRPVGRGSDPFGFVGKIKTKIWPTLSDVIAYPDRVTDELDRLENLEGKRQDVGSRVAKRKNGGSTGGVLSEGVDGRPKKCRRLFKKN